MCMHINRLRKSEVYIYGHIDMHSTFEGSNVINKGTIVIKSNIGFASYIGSNSRVLNANIGRYCCIGRNLDIVYAQHPLYDCLSMHPVFYSTYNYLFSFVKEDRYSLFKYVEKDRSVIIDNDVWIGDNVTILGGIHIGNGVAIAANSVVTKDVPPYAIVGGNPAKVIKYRFSDENIKKLVELRWWDKEFSVLTEVANLFFGDPSTKIETITDTIHALSRDEKDV